MTTSRCLSISLTAPTTCAPRSLPRTVVGHDSALFASSLVSYSLDVCVCVIIAWREDYETTPTVTPTPARNRASQKRRSPSPTSQPSPKRQAASSLVGRRPLVAAAFAVGSQHSPHGRRRSDSEETLRLGQPCTDPYMMGRYSDDDKAHHRWSLLATCNHGSGFCQVHVPCHVFCHVHVSYVMSSLVACHVSRHVHAYPGAGSRTGM